MRGLCMYIWNRLNKFNLFLTRNILLHIFKRKHQKFNVLMIRRAKNKLIKLWLVRWIYFTTMHFHNFFSIQIIIFFSNSACHIIVDLLVFTNTETNFSQQFNYKPFQLFNYIRSSKFRCYTQTHRFHIETF